MTAHRRATREGPRLRVTYYVYGIGAEGEPDAGAMIEIANYGTVPVYISKIGLTSKRPWARLPFIRSASYVTLSRPWFRWLYRNTRIVQLRQRTDPILIGKLEPGQVIEGRLVDEIYSLEADRNRTDVRTEPMSTRGIEHKVLKQNPVAVVETGLRRYWARVVDHRPPEPVTVQT